MKLLTLGSTPMLVTPIGLGMAALGRPGYINLGHGADLERGYGVDAMQARTHAVLGVAYQAGVRYFDAARSYGLAERFLSTWLQSRSIPPEEVAVGSKWGYTYTAGWQVEAEKHEVKEHSLAVLKRQWGESSTYLGDYLRLYQVHSATLESGVLENSEVLAELAHMKRESTLVGLTVSGLQQSVVLERAMNIKIDGSPLFDCVQATWNLLETSAASSLVKAHEMGMGVIVKEALANGRLTDRNTNPGFGHKQFILKEQANRLDTTVDALALAAAVWQPWADVVLSGAATEEHLLSNLKALEVSLDREVIEGLTNLVEPSRDYWNTRDSLPWN